MLLRSCSMCLHHLVLPRPWRTMHPNVPADHHNPLWLFATLWCLKPLGPKGLSESCKCFKLLSWSSTPFLRPLSHGDGWRSVGKFHLIFLWVILIFRLQICYSISSAAWVWRRPSQSQKLYLAKKKTPHQRGIFIGTSDWPCISAQLLVVLQCIFQNQGRAEVHSAHR